MKYWFFIILLIVIVSCTQSEFEDTYTDAPVTAYIDGRFWAADSITEAYYFNNLLHIEAQKGNDVLVIEIKNPQLGSNINAEFEKLSYTAGTRYFDIKSNSGEFQVILNTLDTVNAEQSLVYGVFSGEFISESGQTVKIKEGVINNVLTHSLFCSNDFKAKQTDNTDIAGKWELVRIINKATNEIQLPVCNNKSFINFDNIGQAEGETAPVEFDFYVESEINSLWGNFELPANEQILFTNHMKTAKKGTSYKEFLENLFFNCVIKSTEYYINNSMLHLESDEYIVTLNRRD